MAQPIVEAASGLPVTQAHGALPVVVSDNGYGLPVTFTESMGLPVSLDWILAGSSLDLDFVNNRGWVQGGVPSLASSFLTTSRASDAYADNSAGVWSLFGSGVPRITDKGLLVEEARTNSIRNNSMQGAVAGTPGTAPTNNTVAGSVDGLTQTIVSVGTINGIDVFDIRWVGTTSSARTNRSFYNPESSTQVAASAGQTWAGSMFVALVGGSLTNVSATFGPVEYDAGGVFVAGNFTAVSPTSTLTRFASIRTLTGGTTAFVSNALFFSYASGVAIDITLRIGWPQLELGAFATSPIRTTSAAATRAADAITVTSPPAFGSAYTLFAQAVPLAPSAYGTAQNALETSDGTTSQRAVIRRSAATGGRLFATVGGTGGAVLNSATEWVSGARSKMALALAAGDQAAVFDGGAVTTTTKASLPTTPTSIRLGGNSSGTELLNGWLERVAVAPTRWSNDQLQALTS